MKAINIETANQQEEHSRELQETQPEVSTCGLQELASVELAYVGGGMGVVQFH